MVANASFEISARVLRMQRRQDSAKPPGRAKKSGRGRELNLVATEAEHSTGSLLLPGRVQSNSITRCSEYVAVTLL
jgi:hypothetical protein